MKIHPPQANEYAAFYAGYVARASATDVIELLQAQAGDLRTLLTGVTETQARLRPAPAE